MTPSRPAADPSVDDAPADRRGGTRAEPSVDDAPAEPSGDDAPAGSRRRRRWVSALCWALAGLWAAGALARLTGLHVDRWPLTLAPAVVPYAALGAVVPLAAALATRRWPAAALAAASLLALVGVVAPRALGAPDPGPGPRVRVMTANLRDGSADPRSVVALARAQRVDVLAIDEVTPRELDRLIAAGLPAALPYSATNPSWTRPGGTALFSRYPLTDAAAHPLPLGFVETSATVRVPGAAPVSVYAIHYCAPVDPQQTACWRAGVGSIPPATPAGGARLLLGDFNMTLDFPDLRRVIATGYRDAADTVGTGLATTWPYLGPPLPRVTIDHVLADRRIGITSASTHPIVGSDHRALAATLTFPTG